MREVTFISEEADLRYLMQAYGPVLGRCAGDRLIVNGYVCPHCGSSNPSKNCLSPKPKKERV